MLRNKNKPITFLNPRTGDVWVCENAMNKRQVDGVEFIEVHKPDNPRMFWVNLTTLVKQKNK